MHLHIHQTLTDCWKRILRQNFTRIDQLADFLELNDSQKSQLLKHSKFALNVPYRLAQKMAKQTLDDPLLKQFLPLHDENVITPEYLLDPVNDQGCQKESKLLQKYVGRVLLVCTSACAMHCRYCFRKNFDYDRVDKSFEDELTLIANDISIHEVILSGGDPLSLTNEKLDALLSQIVIMPHIKRIRFHTRFPIGIPERIDEEFLALLKKIPQQVYFVIHCNHPRELDVDVLERLQRVKEAGCILLNQSVLLRDVNDDATTLQELCEELSNNGIIPYYLHQLDRVQGAAHFEVDEIKGLQLVDEISKVLPGYAVPKYVREQAGEPNKTLIYNNNIFITKLN